MRTRPLGVLSRSLPLLRRYQPTGTTAPKNNAPMMTGLTILLKMRPSLNHPRLSGLNERGKISAAARKRTLMKERPKAQYAKNRAENDAEFPVRPGIDPAEARN